MMQGVEQCPARTAPPEPLPDIFFEAGSDASGIAEPAEFGMTGKGCGGGPHQGDGVDRHEHDADPQIRTLVLNETRRDALVDDVALLEKQLPGRHCRADDGDDQQHHLVQRSVVRQSRHQEVPDHPANRRMDHQEHRDERQAANDEEE